MQRIHDKKTLLRKFLHGLETDLYQKTMVHLWNSLGNSNSNIRYSKAQSSKDIKLYVPGQQPRYVHVSRYAKEFLEDLWDDSVKGRGSGLFRLQKYLQAVKESGLKYATSLMGKDLQEHLYKIADSEVYELRAHIELKKDDLRIEKERSDFLAQEKLLKSQSIKKGRLDVAILAISLASILILLLQITSHDQFKQSITGNISFSSSLIYPALTVFSLITLLFVFGISRK